jgi:hypothetical protein
VLERYVIVVLIVVLMVTVVVEVRVIPTAIST